MTSEDPRGCGDDSRDPESGSHTAGRPPRVRGRLAGEPGRGAVGRKTPAGAGTTSGRASRSKRRGEDPRGCGDDTPADLAAKTERGRPPRVRGRRSSRLHVQLAGRKTPAGAGTTPWPRSDHDARAEDPRGCGDDRRSAARRSRPRGRPPRVRGRPRWPRGRRAPARKTPAGAGTTWRGAHRRCSPREDPRGCGDDLPPLGPGPQVCGRPPRVRGRPGWRATTHLGPGKTPAGAGTTSSG